MAKRGPKIKQINWELFKFLCSIKCTLEEICSALEVSEDTIERRVKEQYRVKFADKYAEFSSLGKMSLRRKQHQVALEGDVQMLKWLGIQRLDQRMKHEVESNLQVNISSKEIRDLINRKDNGSNK